MESCGVGIVLNQLVVPDPLSGSAKVEPYDETKKEPAVTPVVGIYAFQIEFLYEFHALIYIVIFSQDFTTPAPAFVSRVAPGCKITSLSSGTSAHF